MNEIDQHLLEHTIRDRSFHSFRAVQHPPHDSNQFASVCEHILHENLQEDDSKKVHTNYARDTYINSTSPIQPAVAHASLQPRTSKRFGANSHYCVAAS